MGNPKYTNLPAEASDEDSLAQIALDVSLSWNDAAATLWERLNPELWELTQNPWVVLQTVSGERLKEITSDRAFQTTLDELAKTRTAEAESPRWFQQSHPNAQLSAI